MAEGEAVLPSLFMLKDIVCAFLSGLTQPTQGECIHADKELRNHLSEEQVDEMVEESFPASDPPSNY